MVPLTTYEDYADVLLLKKEEMLPDQPIIWIQTTWEGGKHPIKVAPYTKGMLQTYKNNVLACMILSTSTQKGQFDIEEADTFLYALAPLPYTTGLIPLALTDEINVEFLPPVKDAVKLSFSERNKKGFKMGLRRGIDFFFGLGSVAYYVSLSAAKMSEGDKTGGKLKKMFSMSPSMLLRYIKAKNVCRKEKRQLKPKDLFHLKGFVCAGTDNRCYKTIWKICGECALLRFFQERSQAASVSRPGPGTACTFSRTPVFMSLFRKMRCTKIWRIPPTSPEPSVWIR